MCRWSWRKSEQKGKTWCDDEDDNELAYLRLDLGCTIQDQTCVLTYPVHLANIFQYLAVSVGDGILLNFFLEEKVAYHHSEYERCTSCRHSAKLSHVTHRKFHAIPLPAILSHCNQGVDGVQSEKRRNAFQCVPHVVCARTSISAAEYLYQINWRGANSLLIRMELENQHSVL